MRRLRQRLLASVLSPASHSSPLPHSLTPSFRSHLSTLSTLSHSHTRHITTQSTVASDCVTQCLDDYKELLKISRDVSSALHKCVSEGVALPLPRIAHLYTTLCRDVSEYDTATDTELSEVTATLTLLNSHLRDTLATYDTSDGNQVFELLGEIIRVTTLPLPVMRRTEKMNDELVAAVQSIAEFIHVSVHGVSQESSLSSATPSSTESDMFLNLLDNEPIAQPAPICYSVALLNGRNVVDLLQNLEGVELLSVVHDGQQVYDDNQQAVLGVLSTLSDRLRQDDCILYPEDVSKAMSTLHNKSSDYKEVRMVFGSVIGHIATTKGSEPWSPQLIQSCMSGFSSMDDKNNVILKGVKKMTSLIISSDNDMWTFDAVAHCLRGLQGMRAETKEVKAILEALTKKLRYDIDVSTNVSNVTFEVLVIGMLGLQRMNSQSNEVKQLLKGFTVYINKRINFNTESHFAMSLSHCLVGICRMNIHHAEVYSLVDSLARKINAVSYQTIEEFAEGGFDQPSTLKILIRSLSNYSSDYQATTKLLKAIVLQHDKARKCLGGSRLRSNDFLGMLFGFKNCSNSQHDVDMCLKLLVDSVMQNDWKSDDLSSITAFGISNSLIGMRGMTNDLARNSGESVDNILLMLAESLKYLQSSEKSSPSNAQMISSQNLSVALQGLQGISCDSRFVAATDSTTPVSSPSVVVFLDALIDTLQFQEMYLHTDPTSEMLDTVRGMNLTQCSRALYGLLHIHHAASPSILALKKCIAIKAEECLTFHYGDTTHAHKKDITNISDLLELQRVLNLSVLLNEKYKETATAAQERLYTERIIRLCDWVNNFVVQSAVIVKENETSDNSILERRFRSAILSNLKISEDSLPISSTPYDIKFMSNTNIGGFDADMLITFKRNDCTFVYNLEIDGPQHNKPHKEKFFRLRDEFLTNRGHVTTVRRVSLFSGDPRRVQVINKRAREEVVTRELKLLFDNASEFFNSQ